MQQRVQTLLMRSAAVCGFIALLTQATGQDPERFTGTIEEETTGKPSAASIVVTDSQRRNVEIEGEHDHVRYLQKRWCYVSGRFSAPRRDGETLTVEVRRGHQTLPLKETIASNETARTFRLRRWIKMTDAGYINGDTHVHFLNMRQCRLQMQAEDLEVLNLLTSDFTNDAGKFTGSLDRISTPGNWVYVGQEFRDWQQGHINLLKLRKIVPPLEPFGGTFRNMSQRHLLLKPAAEEARGQGATVTWAHFGDMPGAESPIDIALGLIDAVDLITQKDPLLVGLHWEPWKMSQPEQLPKLPALPGIELYYRYLNSGFQLPMASGTDKMGDDIPVGSSRLYVKAGREKTYDAWLAGLKAGRGFITNGPMIEFEADGREPGDTVHFKGTRKVNARAVARSIHPFTRLQVMVNGKAVASSEEPKRDSDGVYSVEIRTRIDLDRSAWMAARVAEPKVEGKAFMPRRMTVFAHSNPIYFWRDGLKVRDQEAIDYLTLYLRYTEHWFRTGARFETDEKKREALEATRLALEVFQKL